MPPILQNTKSHQKLIISDQHFGGIWCFCDLVAKNRQLQAQSLNIEV